MNVRPSHRQHAEAFIVGAGRMILEPCEQLHCFAAVTIKHRIVKDEYGQAVIGSQSLDFLNRRSA